MTHSATHDSGTRDDWPGAVPVSPSPGQRGRWSHRTSDHRPLGGRAVGSIDVAACGHVIDISPGAAGLLGRRADECAGTPLSELLGDEARAVLRSDHPVDVVAPLPDGPTSLRLRGTASGGRADGHEVARIVDVQRRAPATGPVADDVTVDLSLIDDISHNLGTPLTVIAGYAETLGERLPDLSPDDLAAATAAIRRHAERAVESLRTIQARMRVGGSGTVPTNLLSAWLRRMLATPLASTGARLVEGHVPPHVGVDESLARQVLLSVCHVLLGADEPPSEITLDATASREGATFVVTGVGVGELRAEHVDMLEMTAALLVDAGGGYERREDGGRHVLRVPANSPGVVPAPRIPVAIIEDDPATASLIRTSLMTPANLFRVVVDERSLGAGIAAVARTQPRLLVIDQHLADDAATDALDRLHDASPSTTIVLLSARRPTTADERGASDRVRWIAKGRVLDDLGTELLTVLADD